jgi:hypothetical protein
MRSSCIVPPIRPGIDARRCRIPQAASWPAAVPAVSGLHMDSSAGLWLTIELRLEPEQEDRASRAMVRQVRSTSCGI